MNKKRELVFFVIQFVSFVLIGLIGSSNLTKETILSEMVKGMPSAFILALLVFFVNKKLMKSMENQGIGS